MNQDDARYARYTGEHGFDNRYMTPEELKAKLQKFSLDHPETAIGGGVPFYAEGRDLYLDAKDYHTLILGATGSMKTRVFVMPTVYTLGLAGENMVISDPKGEICEKTSGWLKAQGYDVKIFNLREPSHSDCWNPLYEAFRLYRTGTIEGKDAARNFINDFSSFLGQKLHSERDPYWEIQSARFIEGAILTMFAFEKDYSKISIRSLTSFFAAMAKKEDALGNRVPNDIEAMANNLPFDSLLRDALLGVAVAPENTKNCLLGTMMSEISPFVSSSSISYLTSHNTIDVHVFKEKEKKTALFIIVPDEKTTYHFLAAALIKQLYEVAVGDASSLPGFVLPRRLNFILDEFATMPAIPDMAA
jgi:type IV secretion system protein VirD4